MKLYKVIKNNCAKDGGVFDYTHYLPKLKKDGSYIKGKWTPIIDDVKECSQGYHVTPYWNMFDCEDSQIFEVECKGLVMDTEMSGVIDKGVCKSLRLLKRIFPKYVEKNNTGALNTGNFNTGAFNAGNKNTGNFNTGTKNTGAWNTGDGNTGACNTGDRNTGYRNTGYMNTGNFNTGNFNTGAWNTGDGNTGNFNTGDWNTGDRNTGDWNAGDSHSGWFNVEEDIAPRLLFGKPYVGEYPTFPKWLFVESMNQSSWRKSFNSATDDELIETINLPNFCFKRFEKITGITKKDFIKRKIIEGDGNGRM